MPTPAISLPIERNDATEPDASAFIFGIDVAADGAVSRLSWDRVQAGQASPAAGWRWLHLNRLAPDTRTWLEAHSALGEIVITALLQTETRPRCVAHDGGILLNLRGVNHNPGAEPEDMISVRIWACSRLVITVRSYPVRAIQDVQEEALAGDFPNPGALLSAITARLIDKLDPLVEQLKDDADDFEDTLLDRKERLESDALAEFRQTVLTLRRYIQPQREAIAQLEKLGGAILKPDDAVTIREAADHVTRIAEELDTIRERAAVIQDQAAGQRQEMLNNRLLVLSTISAIFLPLTFLTGLLGMNVAGIPLAHHPHGFWVISSLAVAFGLVLIAVLKLRRWI
jgi:zinc transporter